MECESENERKSAFLDGNKLGRTEEEKESYLGARQQLALHVEPAGLELLLRCGLDHPGCRELALDST